MERKGQVEKMIRIILTISTMVFLMVPTTILYLLPGHGIVKIIIILVFTLLFSSVLTHLTKAYVVGHLPSPHLSLMPKKVEANSKLRIQKETRVIHCFSRVGLPLWK